METQGSYRLCLLVLTVVTIVLCWFLCGCWGSDSGPHACSANALPTLPSPSPPLLTVTPIWSLLSFLSLDIRLLSCYGPVSGPVFYVLPSALKTVLPCGWRTAGHLHPFLATLPLGMSATRTGALWSWSKPPTFPLLPFALNSSGGTCLILQLTNLLLRCLSLLFRPSILNLHDL